MPFAESLLNREPREENNKNTAVQSEAPDNVAAMWLIYLIILLLPLYGDCKDVEYNFEVCVT